MKPMDVKNVQRIGFLLVPNFALMSYASAVEPLRAANLLAATALYQVLTLSMAGGAVTTSSGMSVTCADLVREGPSCHTIFVCAGGGPADWLMAEPAHGILRGLARQGVRIGGISSGAFVLAAAQLLDNRDFTIHWEHAGALKEAFPHLSPRQARYVIDGDRVTCAGGVAPLDMMHAMISERMGSQFARRVSDWFLYTAVAASEAPQRASTAERFGTNHPALLQVLEAMERTFEQPMSRREMAKLTGVSSRHINRLFAENLGTSFLETYRNLRLDHARKLLEQSPLSIAEIAFATGFSSAGHFSRAYQARFLVSPSVSRKRRLADGS
jgi:transcriptional regulator GlxA family with amidase domain